MSICTQEAANKNTVFDVKEYEEPSKFIPCPPADLGVDPPEHLDDLAILYGRHFGEG